MHFVHLTRGSHRARFQLYVSTVGSGAVVRLGSLRLSWWPAHRRQGVFGSSGSQSNVDAPRCWRLNPLRSNRPEFVLDNLFNWMYDHNLCLNKSYESYVAITD